MNSYKDLNQWRRDLERFKANPYDTVLMKAMLNRFINSPTEIKEEIKEILIALVLLGENPNRALSMLLKDKTGITLITKSKEDPWFEC